MTYLSTTAFTSSTTAASLAANPNVWNRTVSAVDAVENTFDTVININDLTATAQDDTLKGNNNANRLYGMGGNDRLVGSGGNDTFDGGLGRDTADYSGMANGITASWPRVWSTSPRGARWWTLVEQEAATSAFTTPMRLSSCH